MKSYTFFIPIIYLFRFYIFSRKHKESDYNIVKPVAKKMLFFSVLFEECPGTAPTHETNTDNQRSRTPLRLLKKTGRTNRPIKSFGRKKVPGFATGSRCENSHRDRKPFRKNRSAIFVLQPASGKKKFIDPGEKS